ncbi:MAG: SAP domain-containing protein [Candidatus Nanopelagicaceae bacterium]
MTVKELRAKLKARGAKVSGRKNELVQRLVESEDHNVTCDGTESDDERNDADTFDDQDWSALEASISESNATVLINDEELPILSTLLFVNKPCGMSTLPTRQVEGYPNFPCLSELVKEWLSTNPVGIDSALVKSS